jgi:hypothetical protein
MRWDEIVVTREDVVLLKNSFERSEVVIVMVAPSARSGSWLVARGRPDR